MSRFDEFRAAVGEVSPRAAVVFGSGLASAATDFVPRASIAVADVPGLAPPTVAGHRGQIAVGHWAGSPVLLGYGRVHGYEGHALERTTGFVRLAAQLDAKTLILTNAVGGIHPALAPGELMAIRGHRILRGPRAWVEIAAGSEPSSPYDPGLLARLEPHLLTGIYAMLTGPCYETPAEIRALQSLGADAVGMSTATEAEAAAAAGLAVAAISCVTNRAAGLSDEVLAHGDVEKVANRAAAKLGRILGELIAHAAG